MSADLASWLTEHQAILLPRWVAALETAVTHQGNGHEALILSAGTVVAEQGIASMAAQVYAGLVQAAQGDPTVLDERLRQVSLSDQQQSRGLPAVLAMSSELRRLAWAMIRADCVDPLQQVTLMDDLETILEHTVEALTLAWVDHAEQKLQERINQAEFIAESLATATEEADRAALQLSALNEVSQQLATSLDRANLLELVGSKLAVLIDAAHIGIWLPVEWSGDLPVVPCLELAWSGVEDKTAPLDLAELPAGDLLYRAYHGGRLVFEPTPDAAAQGAWYHQCCAVVILPLLVNERTTGVIILQDPEPDQQLSRPQQHLARAIANNAAIVFENARLYEQIQRFNLKLENQVTERTRELQDERDRLSTVHEIATEVSSTLDRDQILNASLEVLARITQAEHGSIMLIEADTGHLVNCATLDGLLTSAYTRFPMGVGIAGWVAQHKQAALIPDVAIDERWVSLPEGSLRKREGTMVAVPLVVQNEIQGVLTLSHQKIGHFDEGHVRLLEASAGAIAIGIHNANLFTMISEEYARRTELLERQRNEASQINAILQSLSDGVIVSDLYGSVLTANPAAGQILQHALEDLVMWNLRELLAKHLGTRQDEMPLDELLARPLNSKAEPRTFTTTVEVGMQVASLTMGPVLKEDGELLGALLVIHDITREIEADRLKTEFIGTMSHELRTPMTAIKGFTQLLAMGSLGPLNDTQREFVSTIHSNTERMVGLINDVLDITKIESGSVELELRSLHLAEVLSGVVADLKVLIEGRSHTLTISIPPGLPLVRADAHRLHQICYNLLSNAAKYTPDQGQIWVEAHEATLAELPARVCDSVVADRRYMQVNIRDTGVGISGDELERVFDRFYRTENPLKIEAGGTGLGLSLVKPLVELLGGRIWASSTLNEGSTFSFILPVA